MQQQGPWPPNYAQTPAPPAGGSFELSEVQNVAVRNLAGAAKTWGIVSVAAGAVFLLVAIGLGFLIATVRFAAGSRGGLAGTLAVALGPAAIVNLVCGWFYTSSAQSLLAVVETQGNDIPLLMSAISSLKRAFMIESICLLVGMIGTVILHLSGVMGK